LTVTVPAAIYLSASRREQMPALAMKRFSRISPLAGDFWVIFLYTGTFLFDTASGLLFSLITFFLPGSVPSLRVIPALPSLFPAVPLSGRVPIPDLTVFGATLLFPSRLPDAGFGRCERLLFKFLFIYKNHIWYKGRKKSALFVGLETSLS
jgi:hypothetical protein